MNADAELQGGGQGSCGACQGVAAETPSAIQNRPGLSAIQYRVGDWWRFKQSLLAGLSDKNLPILKTLSTRQDDDFSIALLDAFAVMADVLTFYQERLANESFLRTATERISLQMLGKFIGYELKPGVAASTYLAFNMQSGSTAPAISQLSIGLKAQSIPGPGENPQTFETVETIEARPIWNHMLPQQVRLQTLPPTDNTLWLQGANLNLYPGDVLLLLYPDADGLNLDAQINYIANVQPDNQAAVTKILLQANAAPITAQFPLSDPSLQWDAAQAGVYVLRKKASLYGYNAPDYQLLHRNDTTPPGAGADWPLAYESGFDYGLTLDQVYPQVVPGSWALWSDPYSSYSPLILYVSGVYEAGFSDYALAGKASELVVDFDSTKVPPGFTLAPQSFGELRNVSVYLQSEKLSLAVIPITDSVPAAMDGSDAQQIAFSLSLAGLQPGQNLALSGKRPRLKLLLPSADLVLADARTLPLKQGDSLLLLALPTLDAGGNPTWPLQDKEGNQGTLATPVGSFAFQPAQDKDEVIGEVVQIDACQDLPLATVLTTNDQIVKITQVSLRSRLQFVYDRSTLTLNGNVAAATHGESVQEVLGNGDASQIFLRFGLKQDPLTYTASTLPGGVKSSLRVFVNDLEWHEVESLSTQGPDDRVFICRKDINGKTYVKFGDGITGARLPTGLQNIRANYRRGLGAGGLAKTGQISLLLSRPLGLVDVRNPVPATDAQDPETLEQSRRNAPLSVRTLERVVSLQDFQDFSLAFAGIAKALATWTWFGQNRGIYITIAGVNGKAVSSEGRSRLIQSLKKYGDPFVPLRVENQQPLLFRMGCRVKKTADYQIDLVLKAVESALRLAFGFDARDLGQAVSEAEVTAVIQAVPGVWACEITGLYVQGDADPQAGLKDFLRAKLPHPGQRGLTDPAQLLILDPGPLDLLEELK